MDSTPNGPPRGYLGEYSMPNITEASQARVAPPLNTIIENSHASHEGPFHLEASVLNSFFPYLDDAQELESEVRADIELYNDDPIGSKDLTDPMKIAPTAKVIGNQDLTYLIEVLEERVEDIQDVGMRKNIQALFDVYTSANSLKGLHRFLHEDQPRLAGRPLPDGSNLRNLYVNPDYDKNPSIRDEWRLHRYWIRNLHYPGLLYFPDLSSTTQPSRLREEKFISTYRTSRYLYQKDLDEHQPDATDNFTLRSTDPNIQGLSWLQHSRRIILQTLEQTAAMAYAQPRPSLQTQARRQLATMGGGQPPSLQDMSRCQRLAHNLDHDHGLLERIVNFLDTSLKQHPFEYLIVNLLTLENTFERELAVEHVEDTLINKQVSLYDEENFAQSQAETLDFVAALDDSEYSREEQMVYKLLEETSLINRQRRNFRLLRDWQRKRPWRQIYQLYDETEPGFEWLEDAMRDFATNINLPSLSTPQNPISNDLSNYSNTIPHLFPFLPIPLSNVPASHPLHKNCPLCNSPFLLNAHFASSVMHLHCKAHFFHLSCILTYWDQPGLYLHRCPVCRLSAQLSWQRVGLRPDLDPAFALNLSAYPVSLSTLRDLSSSGPAGERARKLYDVPLPPHSGSESRLSDREKEFWVRENMAILTARENPLHWKGWVFKPGKRGTWNPEMDVVLQTGLTSTWDGRVVDSGFVRRLPFDRVARDVGRRWMEGDVGGRERRERDPAQDVYGRGRRVLKPSRMPPKAEAALARRERRKRDRRRREGVLNGGRGLGGPPGSTYKF